MAEAPDHLDEVRDRLRRRTRSATVRALGLQRLHQTVVHEDNRTIRGMVHKVRHLVTVEEVE